MRECGPDCTETLLEVEAYLDGEVDPDARRAHTEAIGRCSPCMDRAEFRKHLKELVATRCIERDVPEALRDRIRRSSPTRSLREVPSGLRVSVRVSTDDGRLRLGHAFPDATEGGPMTDTADARHDPRRCGRTRTTTSSLGRADGDGRPQPASAWST